MQKKYYNGVKQPIRDSTQTAQCFDALIQYSSENLIILD